MLTKDEVVAAATDFLKNRAYPDRPDSVVVLPETGVEFTYGWTIRFDFKEHIETGDPAQAPFTSVVVVPHDGSTVHLAPTFPAVAEYMDLQAAGNWPPRKGH
ncbi:MULTISPECIES: YrhB domain-containing protein [unclassified Streptomyces]|uniref:YrhB domain-containing protein n=1 Tax=unclassified Streptomyces TaxID=2593676 RepID=UPI0033BF3D70